MIVMEGNSLEGQPLGDLHIGHAKVRDVWMGDARD